MTRPARLQLVLVETVQRGRWSDMFKYLSAASVLVTLVLCGCSSESGESPNSAGSSNSGGSTVDSTESTGASCGANRQKLTCGELKTKIEEDSKSVAFEVKVELGPWTDVPDALKVLP